MSNYHFFVLSQPSSESVAKAFSFAQQLVSEDKSIKQIFFYQEAVKLLQEVERLKAWLDLRVPLKFCANYVEQFGLKSVDQPGVQVTGLVDFFMVHWQDHGMLLEF